MELKQTLTARPRPQPPVRRGGLDLIETIGLAWGSLLANKLRSALTMLGVIIGIAAVIAMVAIGRGAQQQTEAQLKSLGSNLIFVQNGAAVFAGTPGASRGAGTATTLSWDDARAIAASSQSIAGVAPSLNGRAQVVYGEANTNTNLLGTTPEYVAVRDFLPLSGRFFNQLELEQGAKVAVLGQTVVDALGLDARSAVGKSVRIQGEDFLVVGTLEYKGATQFRDQDDQVVLPLTTMARRIVGVNSLNGIALSSISVSAKSADQIDAAQYQMTNLLRLRHKIVPPREDDFIIRNQADLVEASNSVTGIFTILLGVTAAISLVVGGIGIMNIMLVSVSERTREIGIRKAIGARRSDILWQFLIEAVVLSTSGGLAGIALGLGAAWAVSATLGWQTSVAPESIALSLVVCLAIGVFFGVYPARQAARLDPIQALRTD
ncbi:ABC transporter permease [Gloeobacter kilaueensis]|uniref:Macrolide transporter ATP-binding /permease protein n=1 Tax=Gloeobacter kilaueensis (strain ATCC BAA-2537 / CCAP 1431/1 / ULC 316 / JS1) TaxID=1183438 RepID=U5QLI4_GLOK1|nr:ABC transporter permease [Gloeobacter kilaueensis]AGY58464.1 macrolide transporter ATP-binding /permease protein [Gloeobacter kilaueensis JS1]